jgi:hypothetical protein
MITPIWFGGWCYSRWLGPIELRENNFSDTYKPILPKLFLSVTKALLRTV